jgi:hypothetical protein
MLVLGLSLGQNTASHFICAAVHAEQSTKLVPLLLFVDTVNLVGVLVQTLQLLEINHLGFPKESLPLTHFLQGIKKVQKIEALNFLLVKKDFVN